MKISVIAASELDASLVDIWQQIQRGDATLRSPYYCPEFTQLVAGAGREVRVAVIESQGAFRGFFPYEKDSWGRLRPVGQGLNDYHGLIASPGLDVDVATLLRACGGRYFGFNHMPLTQAVFAPFIQFHSASPVMALQGGWDAYVQRLCEAQNTRSPGILTSVRSSIKRIERDLGPLRFEMNEKKVSVLETLIRLKSEQWVRTVGAASDAFAVPWIRQLIHTGLSLQGQGGDFSGALCALYAGDKLVAAHFGLRAGAVLHYWFPVYDTAYAYYNPGLILLKEMAEQGAKDGLTEIDLGRGTAGYKMRFKTDLIPLGEGAVSRPAIVASAVLAAKLAKAKVAADPRVVRFRQWKAARQAVSSVGVGVAENQKNGSQNNADVKRD